MPTVKVDLAPEDQDTLEREMERNGYATKASFLRALVRGMRKEINRELGTLTADLRLQTVLMELVDSMERHERRCGASCSHAMREYQRIRDKYRVHYVPKKDPEASWDMVPIPYSPSGRREE